MSLDLLGPGFDLHTGGLDLAFPHHENERAQAVAAGRGFARHWMHHGFVELGGEKMSKSLGNVRNLLDLADAFDPRAYRLLVVQSHYRSPMEVTDVTMKNAEAAIGRLDALARRVGGLSGTPDPATLQEFETVMSNDLDTAGGADLMFRRVREANTLLDGGDRSAGVTAALTALEIAAVFGLELRLGGEEIPADIAGLLARRSEARAARDWALADEIRDDLTAAGWTVEDGPDGPIARRIG